MTRISSCIFKGLFKNIVFRSVALVTKKVMGYFRFFFTDRTLFSALSPTLQIKKKNVNKKSFNYYSLKVTKFHGDIVKNESGRTKKTTRGEGVRVKRPS